MIMIDFLKLESIRFMSILSDSIIVETIDGVKYVGINGIIVPDILGLIIVSWAFKKQKIYFKKLDIDNYKKSLLDLNQVYFSTNQLNSSLITNLVEHAKIAIKDWSTKNLSEFYQSMKY